MFTPDICHYVQCPDLTPFYTYFYVANGLMGIQIYQFLPLHSKEMKAITIEKYDFGATIISGPLLLPEDSECRILDITGRVVIPDKIKPGIYFIEIDGRITRKVIKIK